ncbi:hypothetical protein HYU11_03185 [Candidatus Woesearchaeota archaeon]|nr:hypothetical protein [Candidatus Woesearchaeota archaeon]
MRLKSVLVKAAASLLAVAFLFLVFGQNLRLLAAFAVLLLVSSFSTFYHNYFHGPINFELVKFSTVIMSVAFGWPVAVLFGISATVVSRLWSGRIDHRILPSVLGIIMVSFWASALNGLEIRQLGLILTIAYHAITAPISLAMGDNPGFVAAYSFTNIVFNSLIFFFLGPPAVALIA